MERRIRDSTKALVFLSERESGVYGAVALDMDFGGDAGAKVSPAQFFVESKAEARFTPLPRSEKAIENSIFLSRIRCLCG